MAGRNCVECLRLRERYAQAMIEHSRLVNEVRRALVERESELLTVLLLSEAQALQERDEADTGLQRHIATAHGSSHADAHPV